MVRTNGTIDNVTSDIAEDTVEYKIVATPAFTFQSNYFPQFNLELLDLPGAMNVPLGSLEIRGNILPCDCQVIKVGILG